MNIELSDDEVVFLKNFLEGTLDDIEEIHICNKKRTIGFLESIVSKLEK